MKKWITLILVITLCSCQQRKHQIERLSIVTDSLEQVAAEKDSAILDFLTGYNEIQANLDSIKEVEKLVTMTTGHQGELKADQKKQILEDITLLNQLLQRNKEMAANLQKKLNSANSKIGQLQGVISQLEQMVANLNSQIEAKDIEIANLTQEVQRLHIDVSNLTNQVEKVTQEVQEKTRTIENQTVELNKGFYAIGTVRELKDNNVLEKTGGVLGVGRTMIMKKDFNHDYFTEVDIRQFTQLPLMVKKAKVISEHPVTSYHITGVKTADTLFVDNPQEFWKASKYLLIVLD